MKKKVLMLVPAETASGGIKNYFHVLKEYFTVPVEYMIRGARNWPYRKSFFYEIKRAYQDLKSFKERIDRGDIGIVQTSTSLGGFSVIRDGFFLFFARRKHIKTIVFFRGWDLSFEKKIENYFLPIFRFFFFNSDKIIVLSSSFKNKLIEWGYEKEILIETTIIDEKLLSDIDFAFIKNKRIIRKNNNVINILFLARIEKPKGIYEAIATYELIKRRNPNLIVSLTIAGSGKELGKVKDYINREKIENIIIKGYVEGEEKRECLLNADIYLFPSYTEGMPNSVLEAMAFGLPIITRNVGAISDIISIGENGFYTDTKDPSVLASFIQKLIDDNELYFKVSENNYIKAIANYTTSKVVHRIENIYKEILYATTNPTT